LLLFQTAKLRQHDFDDAASFGSTVLQFQRAAMRLRYLSREHEADTTAGWLGCVERNKRRIPAATMEALRAKGYEIRPIAQSGLVNGIIIDRATGFRLGGADPRENGYALGW
jgi:gamma-glutamyltranspeptidase